MCLGHSVLIKDHLLIREEQLCKQKKKKKKDRPGYSNKHNGKHPHASQGKRNHVFSIQTHAHTQNVFQIV